MIRLNFNEIKKLLNLDTDIDNWMVEYVTDNIKNIANNTLVFHVNKDREVNENKLVKLTNCFIITDQPLLKNTKDDFRYIFVPNINVAYKTFVSYYRNLFDIPIVAVTGTCGKTSTKEMISQVLKNKYNVVHTLSSKNALNKNNDYLMQFNDKTNFAVFETAITHPGNLILGCETFKPSIGIITTIGIDHLNRCKKHDIYVRTKGEMLTGLQNKGILIINNDDENIRKIDMSNYKGKIVTFGIKRESKFFALDIKYSEGGMNFILKFNDKLYEVYVPGYGEHNVYNALAALAALHYLGMNLNEAINYLKSYIPIRSHIEFKKGVNNSIIVDDTWSSNPTSMYAALKVLKEQGNGKTKIAVIGRISYLGKFETKSYQKIAKMLVENEIDILVTQDINTKIIGIYAEKYGFNAKNIYHCDDKKTLKVTLQELLKENTIALFKWSMLDKTNKDVLESLTEK